MCNITQLVSKLLKFLEINKINMYEKINTCKMRLNGKSSGLYQCKNRN